MSSSETSNSVKSEKNKIKSPSPVQINKSRIPQSLGGGKTAKGGGQPIKIFRSTKRGK